MIKLAASDMADGLFYCSVIKFRDKNPIYINWFFEYGAFDSYSNCKLVKLVEEKFQIPPFPYAVYINFDVIKKKERDMSLFKNRRTGLIDFFVNIILLLSPVHQINTVYRSRDKKLYFLVLWKVNNRKQYCKAVY